MTDYKNLEPKLNHRPALVTLGVVLLASVVFCLTGTH
jgi:hypothetical protein